MPTCNDGGEDDDVMMTSLMQVKFAIDANAPYRGQRQRDQFSPEDGYHRTQ